MKLFSTQPFLKLLFRGVMNQPVLLADTYQKIQNALPKSPLTIIRDATLAKHYNYVDGVIQKTKTEFRNTYQAFVVEINIIDLFMGLASYNDVTLICGYPKYDGAPFIGDVTLFSTKEFSKKYPSITPYIVLVKNADGTVSLHTTRTLDIYHQSVFLLIDIDVSDNAPAHMQHKTTEDILGVLESIAPNCFADTLVVDVPSSSNGITAPNSTIPTGIYKRHLYFQAFDASDIPRFFNALVIKSVIAGHYYTDKDGNVKTLIDKQAVSRERLCYEVTPIMKGGITKKTPPIRLLGSKLLDTKLLTDPTADEIAQYESITGKKRKITTVKNNSVTFDTPNRVSDLTWNMPVTLADGTVITPQQFKEEGLKNEPCHSPFRTDNNPSAKMGLDSKGNPYIYDSGTGISHFLVLEKESSAIEGELVDAEGAVNVDEMFDIYTTAEAIAEMNANYALVMMGGKCLILEKNSYNPALKCKCIAFHPTSTFTTFNAHKRVKIDNEYLSIVKYWLSHRLATRYNNMVFNPTNEPQAEGVFNLFSGLNRKPKKGSWRKFLWHIRHIICRGDKKLTRYVIAWLANMVQGRPKPGVALVLIGGKGTGKGSFANTIGQLFGRHFLQIVQRNQLTGNFNAHLREAYLVFADEAFWAGDKQAESALKALITEPLLMIEQKGLDAFQIANYTNFIFATNNEWSVPAGQGERRFCVFNVPRQLT